MKLLDKNGRDMCKVTLVMHPCCLHCKSALKAEDGKFLALDSPYHGLLHFNCAPFYAYPPTWPHDKPAIAYENSNN